MREISIIQTIERKIKIPKITKFIETECCDELCECIGTDHCDTDCDNCILDLDNFDIFKDLINNLK